jgi:hypothetical protein
MSAQPIVIKPDYRSMDLSKKRFYHTDFSGQDLSKCKLKQSLFFCCTFDGSNLSEADCEGSEFTGSSFRKTNCYRTNFKDCKMGQVIWEPKDCMGMTITLACNTFSEARISPLWWMALLIFATMMKPVGTTEPLVDNLIAMIGAERYAKLRALFGKRDF